MNFKAVFALPKTARSAKTHKSISFVWIVWSTLYVYLCTTGSCTKGQLISKGFFFNSQKNTKNLSFQVPCLGVLETQKRHFKINWPLPITGPVNFTETNWADPTRLKSLSDCAYMTSLESSRNLKTYIYLGRTKSHQKSWEIKKILQNEKDCQIMSRPQHKLKGSSAPQYILGQ